MIAFVPGKGGQRHPSPSPFESTLYWVAIQQLPWDPQDEVGEGLRNVFKNILQLIDLMLTWEYIYNNSWWRTLCCATWTTMARWSRTMMIAFVTTSAGLSSMKSIILQWCRMAKSPLSCEWRWLTTNDKIAGTLRASVWRGSWESFPSVVVVRRPGEDYRH